MTLSTCKTTGNSPSAITVGGLDDGNAPDLSAAQLYRFPLVKLPKALQKPELIAPAVWIAPLLPGEAPQQTAALYERYEA